MWRNPGGLLWMGLDIHCVGGGGGVRLCYLQLVDRGMLGAALLAAAPSTGDCMFSLCPPSAEERGRLLDCVSHSSFLRQDYSQLRGA